MNVEQRIKAFSRLGTDLLQKIESRDEQLMAVVKNAYIQNNWFVEENVLRALKAIGNMLTEDSLRKWTSNYTSLKSSEIHPSKKVACILAGNIPAVGFHDMLCVLMSGYHFIGKLSSDDQLLLPHIAQLLIAIEPAFNEQIAFTRGQLKNMDMVIATGSNNSARYFEYYFGKYPHIIRKNRHSVAVLSGNETTDQLILLGKDIFSYYGLGCRNVSKLFIPKGYDLNQVFAAIYEFKEVVNHNKYGNNYDYNKAIYLMGGESLLENGFVLLKEDIGLASPVGVLFYEYYSSRNQLQERLKMDVGQIQCVVSGMPIAEHTVAFGQTQQPALWDYADNVDTLRFLINH